MRSPPARLERDFGRKAWGDEGYAHEELVAELGSAFLCADLELTPEVRDDHASYIASWLEVLKNDNRAIGTVTVTYEYGLFEKPVVDWATANRTAKERCNAWHYKNAEAFGGSQNRCLAVNGYGDCMRTQVNVTYQCTDK